MWRAELDLAGDLESTAEFQKQFDLDSKLPFLFEVIYANSDSFFLEIINGRERIKITDLSFGHNRSTGQDSLVISFPEYNTYIKAYFEEDLLEGRWYVPGKGDYSIPFLARHGKADRFEHVEESQGLNVSGKYAVVFGIDDENEEYPAVGTFTQDGEIVNGTFETETGDYRYLSGEVVGNHLWLSCFDGSHAFLFKSKISPTGQMTGFFKSGKHWQTLWTAEKDSLARLSDPDSLSKPTEDVFIFNFQDENDDPIDLNSGKFQGKAKVIQIMGTWCPNCKDESLFLADFHKNKPSNLEIISVAFERQKNAEEAYGLINAYKDKLDIQYDIVLGGQASKAEASEKFPSITEIISFPTLIFLDEANQIRRIHTGFNGPATDKYQPFLESFSKTISEITSP